MLVVSSGKQAVGNPGAVVEAARAQVRGEQRVEPEALPDELVGDHEHVAQRVGQELERELVVLALVDDPRQRRMRRVGHEPVAVDTLELEPAVGPRDDEAEVADLGLAGRRPVDLVDDAVAERDPEPARAQRGRHHVLRARGPGRRVPWRAERLSRGHVRDANRRSPAGAARPATGLPAAARRATGPRAAAARPARSEKRR